jgi:hypothetical protein
VPCQPSGLARSNAAPEFGGRSLPMNQLDAARSDPPPPHIPAVPPPRAPVLYGIRWTGGEECAWVN